ncbi:hypothetical protein OAO01_02790 [Oligoflexia bacterium]|nr:hypothetical protein [Oligoflexia bacterium]
MLEKELTKRLLAVDPSLTCTGWALFSVQTEELLAVGKIRSMAARYALASRLEDLQRKIAQVLEELNLSYNDVLVCESQTTMRDPRAAFLVEQVRGIFETLARARSVTVPGRINPRSVQYEVMGLKGKQVSRTMVKDTALTIVQTVYGEALQQMGFDFESAKLGKQQDIVDAILVGALGLTKISSATSAQVALAEVFEEKRSKRTAYRVT